MKAILVILLLAVIGALATAGVMMLRKPGREDERRFGMAKALAWRVALSIGAFLLVMLAWFMGWIQPTGIPLSA
jgi:NADH:ubiquinone oxidoreductase subunit 6 (subunit J)